MIAKTDNDVFWQLTHVFYLFVFLFLGRIESIQIFVNNIFMPTFVIIFFLKYGISFSNFSKEYSFYIYLFIWCLIGYVFIIDETYYFKYLKLFIINFTVIFTIYSIIETKNFELVFLSFILGGLFIVSEAIFINPDFDNLNETDRLKGLSGNSNGLAYISLLGIMAIAYIWNNKSIIRLKPYFYIIIPLLIYGIVLSASRKSFFSLLLFLSLWVFIVNINKIKNPVSVMAILLISILTFNFFIDYISENTFLGKRLESVGEESGDIKRQELYKEGFEMVLSNPIYGVGLGNFVANSNLKAYSHSDLMEILATTGIVGLLLYLSIYSIFIKRIFFILKNNSNEIINYKMYISLLIILTLFLIGLGRPHFIDIFTIPFLFILIADSYKIKNSIYA
jgi:O-antigen ligase